MRRLGGVALILLACGGSGPDGAVDAGNADGDVDAAEVLEPGPFSFFVTSYETIKKQSGTTDADGPENIGFGGDFGGLAGADAICQTAAADVGFGDATWRAFLSTTTVDAIDRIGDGPWFDRAGRLIARDKTGLLATRPLGNAQATADLMDELGGLTSTLGDAHDVVTGSDTEGRFAGTGPESTCMDWTSDAAIGQNVVMAGHSFPRRASIGHQWLSDHPLRGCSVGINFVQNGGGVGTCIGCSGGYGAIYCIAVPD